jgi:AraC-like DNA-binding protein
MKLTDLHQFKATLSLIESLLGVEIHDIKTISEYSTNLTQINALEKVTNAITTEIAFDDHDYTDTDIQDRILFYISHGMVENLENLVIPEQFMESMNRLSLRYVKNSLIVLNSLSQRAALSAGVPLRSTDSLGRAFSDQIESSPDVESLIQLSARMFIPAAYARLVRDVNIPGNTSRDIRTVIIYVQNHFREQITVKKLAELVNLSEEHLSRKFKSETGMTLKSFIVKEKIHEAEALLRFTDLSLSSISEILSFSSQSWFQTAFKKQTGKTPMEYRKEA